MNGGGIKLGRRGLCHFTPGPFPYGVRFYYFDLQNNCKKGCEMIMKIRSLLCLNFSQLANYKVPQITFFRCTCLLLINYPTPIQGHLI